MVRNCRELFPRRRMERPVAVHWRWRCKRRPGEDSANSESLCAEGPSVDREKISPSKKSPRSLSFHGLSPPPPPSPG